MGEFHVLVLFFNLNPNITVGFSIKFDKLGLLSIFLVFFDLFL